MKRAYALIYGLFALALISLVVVELAERLFIDQTSYSYREDYIKGRYWAEGQARAILASEKEKTVNPLGADFDNYQELKVPGLENINYKGLVFSYKLWKRLGAIDGDDFINPEDMLVHVDSENPDYLKLLAALNLEKEGYKRLDSSKSWLIRRSLAGDIVYMEEGNTSYGLASYSKTDFILPEKVSYIRQGDSKLEPTIRAIAIIGPETIIDVDVKIRGVVIVKGLPDYRSGSIVVNGLVISELEKLPEYILYDNMKKDGAWDPDKLKNHAELGQKYLKDYLNFNEGDRKVHYKLKESLDRP